MLDMKSKKNDLLEKLNGRPILIWGSRMTGIGFSRFARKYGLNAIGFVDSDTSLTGKEVCKLPIYDPGIIPSWKDQYKKLAIVIAVSIKEDEIIDSLKEKGISEIDYVKYSEYCGRFYTIDVAGACNLKCPSCAHTMENMKNPKGFMTLDDFKKIIEKMMKEEDLVTHICLYSWGEPFLHPKLNLFINHAHTLGIATAVSTNLSIKSSNQIEKIVKTSPDYLKISLSGYYPEVYNTTHTGGDINLVKSNLYKLKYFIEKHESSIFVEVNYHLYKNNIGIDQNKMKELCDEIGFAFSSCYANVTPVERLIDYCEGNLDAKTQEFLKLLLVGIDKGLEITKPYRNLPCRFLTNQVNINWDRSVPLCCVCFDRQTSIISSDYLKDSLKDILINKKNHPLCRKCKRYGFPPYLLGVNQKGWKNEANRNAVETKSPKTIGT
jgi:MoaA/NifB/PqqE/SkfB family radical SAM enzyme